MIPVDALLFDLDGTLIDSKRDLAHSVQFLQKRYRVPCKLRAAGGGLCRRWGCEARPARSAAARDRGSGGGRGRSLSSIIGEHCLDHTRVYPGVLMTLKHFHRKKMAVVTNKPVRVSGYILDQLGLSAYFEVLIGGDSLPNKKPHPEPVLSALKTMRLNDPQDAS